MTSAVRAALYLRVSTRDQSVENQECELRQWAEDQTLVLGWIEAGPDRDVVKRSFQSWEGRDPTEDEVALRVKGWQLDHLGPIAEALHEPWKTRYDELVRELGVPSASDLAVERTGVFVGPTSPLGVGELKAKPVGEIIEYLKAWVPPGGFMAPSREGVGRALTEAVAADPARFVTAVQRFREVPRAKRGRRRASTRSPRSVKFLSATSIRGSILRLRSVRLTGATCPGSSFSTRPG